jgi:Zn ribbon nucleic-acid-binding protein
MEKCPHCEQAKLDEYREHYECPKCGYVQYKKGKVDVKEEIAKLREEYKTSSLFNPPTNELQEAKRKAWRDWASRNPEKVEAMRERKKQERREARQNNGRENA